MLKYFDIGSKITRVLNSLRIPSQVPKGDREASSLLQETLVNSLAKIKKSS